MRSQGAMRDFRLEGAAMPSWSFSLAAQHRRHFVVEISADLFEPALYADRSDWQIVERGGVNPFDSAIPGRDVSCSGL